MHLIEAVTRRPNIEQLRQHYGVNGITVANIYTDATTQTPDFYGLVDVIALRREREQIAQKYGGVNFFIDPTVERLFAKADRLAAVGVEIQRRASLLTAVDTLFGSVDAERKKRIQLAVVAADVSAENLEHKLINQAQKTAQNGDSYRVDKTLNVMTLCYINIKIEGVSIADAAERVKPAHEFLKFLVGAQLIANGEDPRPYAKENLSTPLWNEAPTVSINRLLHACALINSLYLSSPDMIDELPFEGTDFNEIKQEAQRLLSSFAKNIANIQAVVLNPESTEFPPLVDALNSYIKQGGIARKIALHILFNGPDTYIKNLYRAAVDASEGRNPNSFYVQLIEPLEEFIVDSTITDGLLTAADVGTFFNSIEEKQSPSLEQLEKISLAVASTTRDRFFTIEPDLLNMEELVRPNDVSLEIDQYNPRKFIVRLEYQNDEGEYQLIYFAVDTKKTQQGVEWSFAESPSQMPGVRDVLARVAYKVLEAAQADARSKKFSSSEKAKSASVSKAPKGTKSIRPLPEIYIGSRKRRSIRTHNDVESPEVKEDSQRTEVRKVIVVGDRKKLDEQLQELQPQDRSRILDAIREFNRRGASGKFEKLGGWAKGRDLYRLIVKSPDKKHLRILLRELKADEEHPSLRRFEVVKAGDKEDAFKGVAKAKNNPFH